MGHRKIDSDSLETTTFCEILRRLISKQASAISEEIGREWSGSLRDKDVADFLGVKQPALWRILKGRPPRNLEVLVNIAKTLKADEAEIRELVYLADVIRTQRSAKNWPNLKRYFSGIAGALLQKDVLLAQRQTLGNVKRNLSMDWGPDLWRHERIHEGAVEVDPREDVPLDKNKILEIIHGLRPNWPSEQKTSVNADSLEMLQDSIEPYLRVLTDSLQANGVRESQLREDTAHCRGCCIGPLRIERVDLRPDQVLSAGESGVTVIFMLRGSASLKSGNAQAIELSPNKRNLVAFGNNDEWNHRLTGGRNGAGILFIMISSPEEALDCLIQARASMGLLSKEDIGRSRFGTDRQPPYVSRFQENTGNE